MAESEWVKCLTCSDPTGMLNLLQNRARHRKLRLFAAACARRVLSLVEDERIREAIQLAERYADGNADEDARTTAEVRAEVVRAAAQAAYDAEVNESTYAESDDVIAHGFTLLAAADAATAGLATVVESAEQASRRASEASANAEEWSMRASRWHAGTGSDSLESYEEKAIQARLLACVFGNPFQPVTIDPSLLNETVLRLADTIYREQSWDRLPILADALEEGGCTQTPVLEHLRDEGPHARGCFAVDLILGKG